MYDSNDRIYCDRCDGEIDGSHVWFYDTTGDVILHYHTACSGPKTIVRGEN